MTSKSLIGLAIATALLAVSLPSQANIPLEQISKNNLETVATAWFVQFKSAPGNSKSQQQAMKAEHSSFLKEANSAGIKFKERRSFSRVWNGMSLDISAENAKKLKSLSNVKGVWPVVKFDMPVQQASSSPDLLSAIAMTGADIAQNTLGFTGTGVKVAIMDTGIDVDNADFGGDNIARNNSYLFPSARVAYGYDFVGDAYNADPSSPNYSPIPMPDSNPDDCAGHGTHVAGIVGANSHVIKGVAPNVTLGAYRVFGCNGSTDADIMLAAMEMALDDGMDILNMSIGSSFQWPQYPTAVAASQLVDEGMVVVASIGNSGTSGLYAAGAPGLGDKVIGTASIDNSNVLGPYFSVDQSEITYSKMTYSGAIPTTGSIEYTYIGDACNGSSFDSDPSGIAALITRGGCSFAEKASNAINTGAIAVIVHNNESGNFNGTLGAPIDGVTPVVAVSLEDGILMKAKPVGTVLTWTDQLSSSPNLTGGLISSFSSYGLSPDLTLKPDIAAPGGAIYSSYPVELGGHATLGGTSMSSPHVAGAAALVLQAKPDTNAEEMRALLQNSADPSLLVIAPFPGLLEPVHRQGAGMVDIDDAILAKTLVTPGKISAGEGEAGPHVEEMTIRNDSDNEVSYQLFYENAISTSGLTTVTGWWFSDAVVSFDQSSVTVNANSSANFQATITPATSPDPETQAATDFGIYGGYIILVPQNGDAIIRVPYAGFVGDYQRIEHMTPGAYGMPWLSVEIDGSLYKVNGPEDWVYSLVGNDVPKFLVHFEHQVEQLQATIHHANSGELVHPVFNKAFVEQYLPRNATAAGFFDISWDGSRLHSNGANGLGNVTQKTKELPNGHYIIKLQALKANGDIENPQHWETWTSPVIAIERP